MTWWKRLLVMVLAAVLLISAVWWGSGRIIPAMRRLSVSQEVRLPVLMYHGVHSNPKKAGDYVITPQALEEDLLYLQRQGCTTVVMSDLIAYVQQGTPLPEKPVMITFDDGYYNNYLNAYPLLQKYNMKAVLSIIVGETDKYSELDENKENYSHVTWDMVNEMMESGLIEIQNHTYNLHKTGNPRRGAAQRKDETTEQYFAAVGADLQKAQDRIEEMTGWRPDTFTYPFGSYSRHSQELLEQLGFADKITHISKRTTRDKLLSYLSAESVRHASLSFDIPFDRQQLADYLCVERAAMSVELSKLQKEGILKTNRNHFELIVS